MFATTYLDEFNNRYLADTNDVRHFSETQEDAEKSLALIIALNPPTKIDEYARGNPKSLEVRRIECYDNGTMVGILRTREDIECSRQGLERVRAMPGWPDASYSREL